MSTISAGTTSTTTLVHSGDTTGSLVFKTNDTGSGGTTAVTIDTSQNVGIGTTTPATKLAVNGGSINVDRAVGGGASQLLMTLGASSGGNFGQISNTGTYWALGYGSSQSTVGTQSVVWDSSGNVGIGTSSPNTRLQASAGSNGSGVVNTLRLQNVGTSAGDGARILFTAGTSTDGAGIASTGVALNSADLRFYTGSSTEAMRIDSSGNLLVGVTSSPLLSTAVFYFDGNSRQGLLIKNTANSQNGAAVRFMDYLGNVSGGGIYYTSSNSITYATSSDYRLKENIAPMNGALAKVAQLKPCTFNWKIDGSNSQGFIAHELQEVVPECVTGAKDAVDEEGNPRYQGIDTSFLVATLTAALQETKALIDQQAETINALTARVAVLEHK